MVMVLGVEDWGTVRLSLPLSYPISSKVSTLSKASFKAVMK